MSHFFLLGPKVFDVVFFNIGFAMNLFLLLSTSSLNKKWTEEKRSSPRKTTIKKQTTLNTLRFAHKNSIISSRARLTNKDNFGHYSPGFQCPSRLLPSRHKRLTPCDGTAFGHRFLPKETKSQCDNNYIFIAALCFLLVAM